MPWTCASCSIDLADDVGDCPTCGSSKESWTLQVDKTRALQISGGRAKLEGRVGVGAAPLGTDAPEAFESELATFCPVVPKAQLQALVDAGQLPPPAHRLIARVVPRKLDRAVTFTVEFAEADPAEHELDGDAFELDDQGAFEAQFLCVFGPEDVSALTLDGIELIDVSEESEDGFAPDVEISAIRKTVELPTKLVGPPGLEVLEVEDICFATGREILLPGGWSASDDLTGLSVVAGALEYARKNPDKRLLIAGHTDSVGSVASNQVLSEDRATNVHLYLSGQKAAWAEHCAKHAEPEDVQSVLKWVAWLHSWDCDPGAIDGKWGKGSQAALDGFRSRYSEEFGAALEAGERSASDWAAFFDVYDTELAFKLKTTVETVNGLRDQVQFTAPPTIGCSEHFPTERPGAPSTNAANRRVDVLFFSEDDLPQLPGEPSGEAVYGEGKFTRDYLSVDDAFKEPEPPYGNAPFEDVDCPYKEIHDEGGEADNDATEESDTELTLSRDVLHQVPLVSRDTLRTSFIASAAMVAAWRDKISIDDDEILSRKGPWERYAPAFHAGSSEDADSSFGLQRLPSKGYTPDDLAKALEELGPLCIRGVGTKEEGRTRVLTGVLNVDGKVTVRLNDPADSSGRVVIPFRTLAYELARNSDDTIPLNATSTAHLSAAHA